MKRLLTIVSHSRLHTKIMITSILLLVVPMLALGYSDYQLSRKTIVDMAQNDVHTIVVKNNQIIDAKLSRAREMIYGFSGDYDVYEILSSIQSHNKTEILQADLRLKEILAKYFGQSMDIYSVQLVAPYFTFGTASSANSEHAKNFIPYDVFPRTELYRDAWDGAGQTVWYPTYDFADMFQLDYLSQMEYDFKYLFSAITLINGAYTQNRDFRHLSEKPILVVNFKESLFGDVFAESLPISDATYFVVDAEGSVVYHTDMEQRANRLELSFLDEVMHQKNGVELMNLEQGEYVVAYVKSEITGWTSVAMIPPKALLHPILTRYMHNVIITGISIVVLFVGLSFALSRLITEPFRVMIRAIVNFGEGRFHTELREQGSYEFKVVMRKFKEMNDKIHKLIEDNYESEIREKEAQIKALNLQLDPHFMYNTLNVISLMSLEKGEYEISDVVVSLSNMMKYLVRHDTTLVPLETDMIYLKSYITIMTKRFEGSFQVEYDLDDSLNAICVPKFFLQPLVENAWIHGFQQGRTAAGLLKISCKRDGMNAVLVVEDNGCGISQEQLNSIFSHNKKVGMMNVNDRIKAYFGEEYGLAIQSKAGQGTKITIVLPCRQAEEVVKYAQ